VRKQESEKAGMYCLFVYNSFITLYFVNCWFTFNIRCVLTESGDCLALCLVTVELP
jgi:hypothetical protein